MNESIILLQYMNGLGKDKTRRPFLIVHDVADELAARLSEVMESAGMFKTTNVLVTAGYYDC